MMRIVLDTNVTISAILNPHGSPPGEILDQVFDQKVSLCLLPFRASTGASPLRFYPRILYLSS